VVFAFAFAGTLLELGAHFPQSPAQFADLTAQFLQVVPQVLDHFGMAFANDDAFLTTRRFPSAWFPALFQMPPHFPGLGLQPFRRLVHAGQVQVFDGHGQVMKTLVKFLDLALGTAFRRFTPLEGALSIPIAHPGLFPPILFQAFGFLMFPQSMQLRDFHFHVGAPLLLPEFRLLESLRLFPFQTHDFLLHLGRLVHLVMSEKFLEVRSEFIQRPFAVPRLLLHRPVLGANVPALLATLGSLVFLGENHGGGQPGQ
jgi:hypothetical protein